MVDISRLKVNVTYDVKAEDLDSARDFLLYTLPPYGENQDVIEWINGNVKPIENKKRGVYEKMD